MDKPKSVGAREKQQEKRLSELLMPPPPNVPNANAKNSSQRVLQSRDSKISPYHPTLGMGWKTINPSGVGVVLGVFGGGVKPDFITSPWGSAGWFWILASVYSSQKDEAETGCADKKEKEKFKANQKGVSRANRGKRNTSARRTCSRSHIRRFLEMG